MNSLDRIVTAIRLWVEDRLPWYDRGAEQEASARTEARRVRAIGARIEGEQSRRLGSYARLRLPR